MSAADDTHSSDQAPQRKDLKDEPPSASPDPRGKNKKKKLKGKVLVDLKEQRQGLLLRIPSPC